MNIVLNTSIIYINQKLKCSFQNYKYVLVLEIWIFQIIKTWYFFTRKKTKNYKIVIQFKLGIILGYMLRMS